MYIFNKKVLLSALMVILGVGLISNQASAQKQIKNEAKLYGQVVDANGQAVADAQVTVKGADAKTKTDDKGMFTFNSLEAGTHTVVVKADGYKKWKKEVEVTKKAKKLKVSLKAKKG